MEETEKHFFTTFNLIKYKLISKYDKRITYGPFDSLEDINLIVKGSMKGFIIEEIYPQITDHMLLELILINMHHEDFFGYPTNIQELKDSTLKQLIETYNKFSVCVTFDGEYQETAINIKQQIQELFTGDE